ncbi:MAG: glycosyltransferase [Leeuwenhoekiella sp.]
MKILLVGEYSNLHNSLKQGLQALGYEVILLGTGDAFKQFPVDIDVSGRYFKRFKLLNYLRQIIFRLTKFDIALLETAIRTRWYLHKTTHFDVIQLINEYPLQTPLFTEKRIIKKLNKLTEKLIILGCGDDFVFMNNLDKLPYHPSIKLKGKIKFPYSEVFLTQRFKKYHEFIFSLKNLIITTDLDYHTVYKGSDNYFGLIPNPVNIDRLNCIENDFSYKIVIFHGINRTNYHKKGNAFFEEALKKIEDKYLNKVEIITVESLPYLQYIKQYDRAHIVLDQTYAIDQGYNALEAMAKGKVVFTGAGEAFCTYYNLVPDSVAIHTIPDAEQIFENLERLIINPTRIKVISDNARSFIETHHNYKEVAHKYLDAWNSISK